MTGAAAEADRHPVARSQKGSVVQNMQSNAGYPTYSTCSNVEPGLAGTSEKRDSSGVSTLAWGRLSTQYSRSGNTEKAVMMHTREHRE